jgi:hypothetical protein
MKTNRLKQLLSEGQPARGVWLGIPSPASARLLSRLPLDWLVVDAEHAPIDAQTLSQMVAAIAEADGPAPLVRIAQASIENIKRALDAGVLYVPGEMCFSNDPSRPIPQNCMRLSFGAPAIPQIQKGIRLLADALGRIL